MEELQERSNATTKLRIDNLEAAIRDIHGNARDAWHTDRRRANYMGLVLDGLQSEIHSFLDEADAWPRVQSTRRELFQAGRLVPAVRYVGDEQFLRDGSQTVGSDFASGGESQEGESGDGNTIE
jgi:hypothetical protein